MKKVKLAVCWQAFLHWKGWRVFAAFCGKLWHSIRKWNGWKVAFDIPMYAVLTLSLLCCVGLGWVFTHGMEQWVPAYALYALSAYTLTALCVKLSAGIRNANSWIQRHPKLAEKLGDRELRLSIGLYSQQIINFSYGIFKIASGVIIGSAWVGADGIYNLAQALIQLFQILRRKKPGSLQQQWKSYRFCGVLILLMHLTLTGIVFQMLNWNRVAENGEILIITTAVFAFYKFIHNFIKIAKDRKHAKPINSSVRMLGLSQAFFAIFSLQASMLHTFGTGERWEHWLNTATGCLVCLLVVAMGVYMIQRGNREIREIQENQNG